MPKIITLYVYIAKKKKNPHPIGFIICHILLNYQKIYQIFNSSLSLSLKVTDLLQKLLNIVLLPLSLTAILFLLPPFLFLKYLFSLKRNICSENVADKVVLITRASSGIGEVCSKLSISHNLVFVDTKCFFFLLYYIDII